MRTLCLPSRAFPDQWPAFAEKAALHTYSTNWELISSPVVFRVLTWFPCSANKNTCPVETGSRICHKSRSNIQLLRDVPLLCMVHCFWDMVNMESKSEESLRSSLSLRFTFRPLQIRIQLSSGKLYLSSVCRSIPHQTCDSADPVSVEFWEEPQKVSFIINGENEGINWPLFFGESLRFIYKLNLECCS